MTNSGKRWTKKDRFGNSIYLTQERWLHIVDDNNHPEMEDYEEYLKLTIKQGTRKQEPLNPRKFRYTKQFDDLPDDVNHIVAIVLFSFELDEYSNTIPNNFIVTAFFKYIHSTR